MLYRRIADISNEDDISLIIEEFDDRFGSPPEEVINLLYQLRVKLKAEKCNLFSISVEGKNILLKYPPSTEENLHRELPDLGKGVRRGKNAYRISMEGRTNWRIRLINLLDKLLTQSEVNH
jgi:transcription-repair coupling factor (superfamily II helicase)